VPRSKDAALASYLSHTADSYEEIVIIGDSPEDMSLKAVAGGTTYLFAHSGAEFRECSADYRIRDLRQILSHA
jgi:phosphoglycolate phosphatase-like HAD superfamily hydrolase